MSSDEVVIDVKNISKRYEIYATPRDRLKQLVFPSIARLFRYLTRVLGKEGAPSSPQYFREFWALHNVSFQVKKGETLGIVGRNGSGKSTLLQLICGTLTSTEGEISVNGRISALLELGSGFNPDYTGRENVFLNGQILGLSQKDIESRFDSIIEFADIGEFIDQPVKTYSSGMVVRLAFSVAVNVEPEILVVDEALAVGDMPFQIKCFSHLRKLRESGTSILFVSHDLSTVHSFCDRAVYLDSGRCLAIGPASAVCRQYELECLKTKLLPSQGKDTHISYSGAPLENAEWVPAEILKCLQRNRKRIVEMKHEGSLSLTIQSFVIIGDGGVQLESIEPTQKVTAYLALQLNRSLTQDFHVSIQIHDRQGMPLMVVRDSSFEDVITGEEGDVLIVSMCFSLPLKSGQYYCQAGVLLFPPGEKYLYGSFNFEHAEVADMVEHAAYFMILPHERHNIPLPVLHETSLKISKLKSRFL